MVPSLHSVAPKFDRPLNGTAVRFGALFAAVVGVTLWAAAVATLLRSVAALFEYPAAFVLVTGLTSLLGLGLGSVAYARYHDLSLPLRVPSRNRLPAATVAVLAPAGLAVGTAVVGNALFDVPLSAIEQRWISPHVSLRFLAVTTLLPALFVGVGYGVLACGVVYERVRDVVDGSDQPGDVPDRPDERSNRSGVPGDVHVATLAVVLVGFYWLLPADVALTSVGSVIELALSLIVGVAFAMTLGLAYRSVATDRVPTLDLRYLPIVVVAALGLVGVGIELTELPRAVGDLLWVAALGTAILGYERTRSLWVPVLSITVFRITVGLVVYAEAVAGLVSGP